MKGKGPALHDSTTAGAAAGADDGGDESEEEADGEGEEGEEEGDDALAWQMLEVAREIWSSAGAEAHAAQLAGAPALPRSGPLQDACLGVSMRRARCGDHLGRGRMPPAGSATLSFQTCLDTGRVPRAMWCRPTACSWQVHSCCGGGQAFGQLGFVRFHST